MTPSEKSAPSVLKVLSGFLLSGLIFALPGAILPAWQHLGEYDFAHFGNYFLALTAGVVIAARVASTVLAKWGLQFLLVFACALACGGLGFLALVSPPAAQIFRIEGMLVLGLAGGLLNMGLFQAISASYREEPAISVALGGAFFGIGSLIAALLVAGTFYADTVPGILLLIAIIPAGFALMFARLTAAAGGCVVMPDANGRLRPHYLGFPVITTQAITNTGSPSGKLMAAFGDLSLAATLGDRREVTLARATQGAGLFENDSVGYRVTERVDVVVHDLGDNTTAGLIVGLIGG